MAKQWIYAVSYNAGNGFGITEIISNKRIDTFDDVLETIEAIKIKNHLKVIPICFNLLRVEEKS